MLTASPTEFVSFDDGSGPAIFAAGAFGDPKPVAKWDGTAWSLMGPTSHGQSVAVFNDGSGAALYAGTWEAGIQKWDGAVWSAVPGTFSGSGPTAMAVFDDGNGSALYVGGRFATIDGLTVNGIAKWDGSAWSALSGPMGTGLTDPSFVIVEGMTVFDDGSGPALYVGGRFTTAGGVVAGNLAKWDGSAWSAPAGLNDLVFALEVFDDGSGPALHAAGRFLVDGSRVAKWDGATWSGLGSTSGDDINDLIVFNDGRGAALYAAGSIGTVSGALVNNVARWDGEDWSALYGPSEIGTDDRVFALGVFDDGGGPALVAGGSFTTAGGTAAPFAARYSCAFGTAADHCNTENGTWGPVFAGPGPSYDLKALATFDSGSGPQIYGGGEFSSIDGVARNGLGRWTGAEWESVNGGVQDSYGDPGEVRELIVFDDGGGQTLFAGGYFEIAGGVPAINIAKYDGMTWSALGSPDLDDGVEVMAIFDDGGGPALYVGGYFTTAGGVTVNGIAKWDGAAWSALTDAGGSGVTTSLGTGNVYAMTVFDDGSGPALYVGGSFTTAGGVTAHDVAKWDGTAWSALAGGTGSIPDSVLALTVFDDGGGPALYAGGDLSTLGGVSVSNIAKWDGTAWSKLDGPAGDGTDDQVYSLSVFDDGGGPALYASGSFSTAGGVTTGRVAKWNGTAWSGVSGPNEAWVTVLATLDDGGGLALYAGGTFDTAGSVVTGGLAKYDGSAWSALAAPASGVNQAVSALTAFDDGSGSALYAGGSFTTAGNILANRVARWDGAAWSALSGPSDNGMDDAVLALVSFDDGGGPALYAGGSFTSAGGIAANHIAKWDGTVWSALAGPSGTGTDGTVSALAVFDDGGGPALYVGGSFTAAGGIAANHIAKWDGTTWSALSGPGGNGLDGTVHALAAFDGELYVGGSFTTAGGETVNHVAKWDGTAWSALFCPTGIGTNGSVLALTVHDGTLHVGGSFDTVAAAPANRIARWNGSEWLTMGGPSGTGMDSDVEALAGFESGTSAMLVAGGSFDTAGGMTTRSIANWRGAWQPVFGPTAVGVYGSVAALAYFDDGLGPVGSDPALYVGGWFETAGGMASQFLARYSCYGGDLFRDGFETGDTSRWAWTAP